jgi:hypothetical protein
MHLKNIYIICAQGAKELPDLKSVLSLNNHQNSEMNYCENMMF